MLFGSLSSVFVFVRGGTALASLRYDADGAEIIILMTKREHDEDKHVKAVTTMTMTVMR